MWTQKLSSLSDTRLLTGLPALGPLLHAAGAVPCCAALLRVVRALGSTRRRFAGLCSCGWLGCCLLAGLPEAAPWRLGFGDALLATSSACHACRACVYISTPCIWVGTEYLTAYVRKGE